MKQKRSKWNKSTNVKLRDSPTLKEHNACRQVKKLEDWSFMFLQFWMAKILASLQLGCQQKLNCHHKQAQPRLRPRLRPSNLGGQKNRVSKFGRGNPNSGPTKFGEPKKLLLFLEGPKYIWEGRWPSKKSSAVTFFLTQHQNFSESQGAQNPAMQWTCESFWLLFHRKLLK